MKTIDHSYPVSLLVTRNGVFILTIWKRKEWLSPYKKTTPSTQTCGHPQKMILCIWWNSEDVLYYELLPRGVINTADIYCQQPRRLGTQSKKNEQRDYVKWCCSTITPARTLLTWQKTLYRGWVGKSIRTHLIHLILRPQIFNFSTLYQITFKDFLSGWKWAPNMGWRLLKLKTTRFLQAGNRKITPALADCCK